MTEMRWAELAGAYALDALDGDEKAAFEARLAVDEELRGLVDEYREAAATIAAAVPDLAPPAALRARVLAGAREARAPTQPDVAPGGATAKSVASSDPRPSIEDARAASESRSSAGRTGGSQHRGRGAFVPWVLLAASVAGLAWVGVSNRSLRTSADALTTQVEALRDSLASVEGERGRLVVLTQALTGANVRVASLTGNVDRRLWLVWNPEQNVLVVAATGLPPALQGRTYQLWGIRGSDAPVSLGTFDTGADGTAVVALAPGAAPDFDVSALTDEPAGGSPQPTTTPFLAGPWRAAHN